MAAREFRQPGKFLRPAREPVRPLDLDGAVRLPARAELDEIHLAFAAALPLAGVVEFGAGGEVLCEDRRLDQASHRFVVRPHGAEERASQRWRREVRRCLRLLLSRKYVRLHSKLYL